MSVFFSPRDFLSPSFDTHKQNSRSLVDGQGVWATYVWESGAPTGPHVSGWGLFLRGGQGSVWHCDHPHLRNPRSFTREGAGAFLLDTRDSASPSEFCFWSLR